MQVTLNHTAIRMGLETLYFSGAHVMLRPLVSGAGALLTLHHVRPARRDRFQPNAGLEVTPQFLDRLLADIRRSGVDIVDMDEAHRRLVEGDFQRRFVGITFDDGYRDTAEYAYPVLKKYDAPFMLYVPTSFPDRFGELWWLGLEAVIAQNNHVALVVNGEERGFDCRSAADKQHLFGQIYWWLRSLPTEEEMREVVRELCARYRVDLPAFCKDLCMDWSELARLAADPLVSIGAHTVNHVILNKVSDKVMRSEIKMGQDVIEAALGRRPAHFAYPFGDRPAIGAREFAIAGELGFKTAVSTRPGMLFREHRDHLFALPRISLNGNFQQLRYVRVLLSGLPTAVSRGFKRVDAA